jgi:hypothetical protein
MMALINQMLKYFDLLVYCDLKFKPMAEYNSQCSPFEGKCDFDLFKISLHLKRGHSVNFLCEGCNNRAVYKDEEGKLYLAKEVGKDIELFPVRVEELMGI